MDNIIEVTAPVEFEVIDDRLHFVLVSGRRRHPFSISFHKARNAAHACSVILDEAERSRQVVQIKRTGGHA